MKVGFTIDKFIIGEGLPGIDKVCYHLVRELENMEGMEIILFQDRYREAGPFDEFEILRFPSLRDLPFVKSLRRSRTGGGADGPFRPPSRVVLFTKDVLRRRTIERSGVDIVHYPTQLERPYRLDGVVPVTTWFP